jgi:hypothetical protein
VFGFKREAIHYIVTTKDLSPSTSRRSPVIILRACTTYCLMSPSQKCRVITVFSSSFHIKSFKKLFRDTPSFRRHRRPSPGHVHTPSMAKGSSARLTPLLLLATVLIDEHVAWSSGPSWWPLSCRCASLWRPPSPSSGHMMEEILAHLPVMEAALFPSPRVWIRQTSLRCEGDLVAGRASGVDPPTRVGVIIIVGYGEEEDEELRRLP